MKSKKQLKQLAERAVTVDRKIKRLKGAYKELDEIINELLKARVKEVKAPGVKLLLVDQFAEKNTAFKATFMRRYELSVVRK